MSLVLQLQADALQRDADVVNLLHRAMVVATKLNLQGFLTWVRSELDGYDGRPVPEYRRVHGEMMGLAYGMTKPAIFDNPSLQDRLSTAPLSEPISELSHLLANSKRVFQFSPPAEIQAAMRQSFGVPAQFFVQVPIHQIQGILDAIKTQLLEWTMRLEAEGILGEGMKFSDEERKHAARDQERLTPQVILNFIGAMHNSQLQQHSPHAHQGP